MNQVIADQAPRRAAIDPTRSFIVQAPAGSGKTELLIQRYLALLGRVEKPQQILAITFTRKAAAEMRNRLLEALTAAEHECPAEAHKAQTWHLASQALGRDRDQGWQLLQNPALLAIQTIDSFNSALVRKMPWLSRFGGLPELADNPDQLYQQATERLLTRLGTRQPGAESLKRLLAHLDNNMQRFQQMLVSMLQKRDQWLRHLYGICADDPCALLETALGQVVEQTLLDLARLLPQRLGEDMLACGRIAAAHLAQGKERPLLCLTDLDWLPRGEVAHLPLWQGLADLLLTGDGFLRKPGGINASLGFPAADNPPRARMQQLLEELVDYPAFSEKLKVCRTLPEARYAQEQREILTGLIELLPLLVGELWLVFRGEGQADYAEIALMARAALGSVDDPSELLLKLDNRLEHILVDEFQDTSWLQFGLLELLTAGWQPGDGRSLFLVGDPMQSIYRFREAEVGLFLQSFEGRLGAQGPRLEPLRLECNFRSQEGIVTWVNQTFATIFPLQSDAATGAVPLAAATAVHGLLAQPAVALTAFNGRDDQSEARLVVALVENLLQQDSTQRIAILVRGRSHLPAILRQLRENGVRYQAQDIEYLGAQPVALDLLSLARALLHRADRLAWISLLRAPWCGLTLTDLHLLAAAAADTTLPAVLQDPQALSGLSADGRERVARIWPVLEKGLQRRGRFSLRQLLESCWIALGGPACYARAAVEDAELVFDLVDQLQQGGELASHTSLEEGLARLFAVPDTAADGRLQVMTIHKSKGLEFEHVILPGLGRMPAASDSPLLRWLEHPQFGLLLAPIAAKDGSDQDPIYQFIGRLEAEKQDFEVSRLLYVAATRARRQLHLFGHAQENSGGELKPAAGSLLKKLWPVFETDFCRQALDAVAEEPGRLGLNLRRLPPAWSVPSASAAPLPKIHLANQVAAQEEATQSLFFSGWEQQSRRHVGTLVHQLLEQLARRGTSWFEEARAGLDLSLKRQLASLGVPAYELDACLDHIRAAVAQTRASRLGGWILQNHADSACELELSGQLDGQLVHAVIDRSFIDDSGIRWVIDYKTSSPKAAESVDSFVRRESEHYRAQLAGYARLMAALEPERLIRTALYFPLIDHFEEVNHA